MKIQCKFLVIFLSVFIGITHAYDGKVLTGNYYTYFNALNSINYVENYYAELKGSTLLLDALASDGTKATAGSVITYSASTTQLGISSAQYAILQKLYGELPDDRDTYTVKACKVDYDGGIAVYEKDSGDCAASELNQQDLYLLSKTDNGKKSLTIRVRYTYSDLSKSKNYSEIFTITRKQIADAQYQMIAKRIEIANGEQPPEAVVRVQLDCTNCDGSNKEYQVSAFKKYKETGFESFTYSVSTITSTTGKVEEVTKLGDVERLFLDEVKNIDGKPIAVNQYQFNRGNTNNDFNGASQYKLDDLFTSLFNQRFHTVGLNLDTCNVKEIGEGKPIKRFKKGDRGFSRTYFKDKDQCRSVAPETTSSTFSVSQLNNDLGKKLPAQKMREYSDFLFNIKDKIEANRKTTNPLSQAKLEAALEKLRQAVSNHYNNKE